MQYFWAFVVGGLICVVGQLLIDLTALTPARVLTGYVVAGVVLSAIGWYAPLAEFAGCGATVPLLGFGHLLAKGVKTAIEEEGAIGILTGGLTAAAAGITTSLVCGVVPSLSLARAERKPLDQKKKPAPRHQRENQLKEKTSSASGPRGAHSHLTIK